MAIPIKIKRSAVPGKVPALGDLALGELGLNTYEGKLYTKKNNGTESIVELSGGGSGGSQTFVATAEPTSFSEGDTYINKLTGARFVRDGSNWVEY